ncbi:DUF3800 domain-containing protein [Rhodovulum sp. P5]|uniref:DUF3800 domain-containing protein n=1 Tax=Rhodovulum sp. P5 TaxID=1564506 RepID=UPI0009DA04A7|nr:DUF3800 domain-containing protein [Rhodovulum sp. P5]
MPTSSEPYEYVLYIDEAGDDGLKRVRPIDEKGASEWLVVSGVLIRHTNESSVVEWVRDIRQDINARQAPALHFRNLSPTKKRRACELLVEKPVVCFAVCSNKKNMRGWNNERAARMGGKQWFYNFCVRFLMERVTDFCLKDSTRKYGASRYLKVVFSQRGGHSYGQTKAYWELLKAQSLAGTTYLDRWVMRHEVLRFRLVDYVPHTSNAGLQLADAVASAFYQACDTLDVVNDPEPAKLLRPRMARAGGLIADYGIVLQPTPPTKARLSEKQKAIFAFYGYDFGARGPRPL